MINKKNIKIWRFCDLAKIGVNLTSFLYKGKENNENVYLSEEDEILNFYFSEFYKMVVEKMIYIINNSHENPDENYINSKGTKAQKNKKIGFCELFFNNLKSKYFELYGGELEEDYITEHCKIRKYKKEEKEKTEEEKRQEKIKKIEKLKKEIEKRKEEIERIKKELQM